MKIKLHLCKKGLQLRKPGAFHGKKSHNCAETGGGGGEDFKYSEPVNVYVRSSTGSLKKSALITATSMICSWLKDCLRG